MHFSTQNHTAHHEHTHHDFEHADIVFISSTDTDLLVFDRAYLALQAQMPDVRLPSYAVIPLSKLQDDHAIEHFIEEVVPEVRLIYMRLLGGYDYWHYGVDALSKAAQSTGEGQQKLSLAVVSGDDTPLGEIPSELLRKSTFAPAEMKELDSFSKAGGVDNFQSVIGVLWDEIGFAHPLPKRTADPIPAAGLYKEIPAKHTGLHKASHVFILFYRAWLWAGETHAIDMLMEELSEQSLTVSAYFLTSLRDPSSQFLNKEIAHKKPKAILTSTSFIAGPESPIATTDIPIFQMINTHQSLKEWQENPHGVEPQSLIMQVALPEIDGHITSHLITYKEATPERQNIKQIHPHKAGIARLAQTVAHATQNTEKANAKRKIAVVMAHYPARDARMANGVGLDTPLSVFEFLDHLAVAGYCTDTPLHPKDSNALIKSFQGDNPKARVNFDLAAYQKMAQEHLHQDLYAKTVERWGKPEDDPHYNRDQKALRIPFLMLGSVAIGLQPSRGYHLNPKDTYHHPDLVPPHAYIAFYLWIRYVFQGDVVVHFGKHGNLEWLPGKAIAQSSTCWSESLIGNLYHVYPFIVNDPGEGAQAKRRTRAVIVDHLTPPLERAESFGDYHILENLLDEFYHAHTMDSKRAKLLEDKIRSVAYTLGLDKECGLSEKPEKEHINLIDAYLCDLKEMQIRAGLHIFGRTPTGRARLHLLTAIARVGAGEQEHEMSILRAIAKDLDLPDSFDPLAPITAKPWLAHKPALLEDLISSPWRHDGDTVERLEVLALKIIEGDVHAHTIGRLTTGVMTHLKATVFKNFDDSGERETRHLLKAIAGQRIPSGPAGAPTRGRREVLPTGKNFFSLDPRTMPTKSAWEIGKKSAEALLTRYKENHGIYPKHLALSAWGTANMRTGGDDIAQILALLGAEPLWDSATAKMTGYKILSLAELGRPRVDLTLRISGFFRDAFSHIIAFLDEVIREIAAQQNESPEQNPLAYQVRQEIQHLLHHENMPEDEAHFIASSRIFGSKPGSYGAGLQALIDADLWQDYQDLADAYLSWSSYIYAAKKATPKRWQQSYSHYGYAQKDALKSRLSHIDLVLHNQDNHEHDLLDSDDYYQFEGGLTAGVRKFKGEHPEVYHIDHARAEYPRVRTLSETIGRVVRGRLTNPKWIKAMQQHGFKGGFEMAASVTYLVAFAATTDAVLQEHFDLVFTALLLDEDNVQFLKENNPDALMEICQKLKLVQDKGLWNSKHNQAHEILERFLQEKQGA